MKHGKTLDNKILNKDSNGQDKKNTAIRQDEIFIEMLTFLDDLGLIKSLKW